jgi:DNA-binding YbaB/EbfC family protein
MSQGMDFNKLMQQAAEMQAEMQRAQAELADQTVEASAGGGAVTVKVSGALEVKEIRIAPEAIDPDDPDLLADTIVAAVNEGLRSAQSMVESRLGGMLGGLKGLGLPGM